MCLRIPIDISAPHPRIPATLPKSSPSLVCYSAVRKVCRHVQRVRAFSPRLDAAGTSGGDHEHLGSIGNVEVAEAGKLR